MVIQFYHFFKIIQCKRFMETIDTPWHIYMASLTNYYTFNLIDKFGVSIQMNYYNRTNRRLGCTEMDFVTICNMTT